MPFSFTTIGADTSTSCCDTLVSARMVCAARRLTSTRGAVLARCRSALLHHLCWSLLWPKQHWPRREVDLYIQSIVAAGSQPGSKAAKRHVRYTACV